MKKLNYFKLLLDTLMGVSFALLFNKQVLGGLSFHEWVGTAIGAAFLVHIGLNWRWVKNVTLQLFDRKLPGLTRFGYALNVLLLISMTAILFSGIVISKILFPGAHIGDQRWFEILHIGLSFVTLIVVGVHIGLHWKWVMNVFSRIIPRSEKKVWVGYALKLVALALLVFGVYEINANQLMQRAASATNFVFTGDTAQMGTIMGGGKEGGRPQGQFPQDQQGTPGTQSTQGTQQRAQEGQSRGGFNRGAEGGEGMQRGPGGGQSVNAFQVLGTYFGMMAVFVILTYYVERLLLRRRRKLATSS